MSETSTLQPVRIFETGLRDGNQMPNAGLSAGDKLVIAGQLVELGVDVIEAGFPGSEPEDLEAVQEIARTYGDKVVVCGFARILPSDIEAAGAAIEPALAHGNGRIHTGIGTSPSHMGKKLRKTPEQVLGDIRKGVSLAAEFTPDVQFYAEDATRSDPEFLMRALYTAVESGATSLMIPDTVGVATPRSYGSLIRRAVREFGDTAEIATHCHDDLGLAVINTLWGIEAGAHEAQAVLAKKGERGGNAQLEPVVVALELHPDEFGGRTTGIHLERLTSVARDVMERSGLPLPPNTPVSGANAFRHESGIHQDGVNKDPVVYEPYDAALVGQETSFSHGGQSGKSGTGRRLESLGIRAETGELEEISRQAKRLAYEENRNVVDSDLEHIAAEIRGETLVDRIELEDWTETKSKGKPSVANVLIDGVRETAESYGGELDALADAIYQAAGIRATVKEWKPHAAGSTDADVGVFAEIADDEGNKVEVYAHSRSSAEAQVNAYVKALNMLCRIKDRRQA
jgi:2-isopropylmalate synthase